MTAPARIQLRRTRGWRKPADAVVVARPGKWGNPFTVGTEMVIDPQAGGDPDGDPVLVTADVAVAAFRHLMATRLADPSPAGDMWRAELEKLNGRDLCCWCAPGLGCHVDVLLELANPVVAPADHPHTYGRGANGVCRVPGCDVESNNGRRRREKQQQRPARAVVSKPATLYDLLRAKGGIDYEGNAQ
jgi:hypothetical protein